MDIASLQISVDSRPARTATDDLDKLTTAGARTEKAMAGVGAGGKAAADGSRQAAAGSREAAAAHARQEQSARQLTATIRSYAQLAVGAFGIRQITQAADAWQGLENRLRLVTKGQAQLAAATNDVFAISQRTSQAMDSTAQVYQRFAQNADALGLSQQKVASLTETVAKAIAVSGGSAAAAEGALMQFGQALASGVLRGEEFNSIMEGAPGLAQALATGLGVPVGALRALAAEGKITGDAIVSALTRAEGSVNDQFNTRVKTIAQSFTELSNATTRYLGEVSKATGASSAIVEALSTLAEGVSSLADGVRTAGPYVMAFGQMAAPAFDVVGSAVSYLAKYADIALAGIAGFAAPALIGGVWALSAALTTGVAGGVKAITAAMLANPLGLLIGGLSAAVYAAYAFRDEINQAIGIDLIGVIKTAANTIIGSFVAAYEDIKYVWGNFGDMMGAAVIGGVNLAIRAINKLIQGSLSGINSMIETINKIPGIDISRVGLGAAIKELANDYADRLSGATAQRNAAVRLAMEKDYIGALGDRFKALSSAADAEDVLANATAKGAKATGAAAKASKEAAKAQKEFEKERERGLQIQYDEISKLSDQADKLEDQVRYYGLSESALNDLTIARLEEQKAALMGFEGAEEEIAIRERMIEQYRRMGVAMRGLEAKEAEKAAWQQWSRDVEGIFQQVGQSLTDAIFEGGKSGRDLVKDLFKTLTLRVVINPVMGALQGAVTNSLGSTFGYSNPSQQQQSGSFNFNSLMGSGAGNLITSIGSMLGSQAMTQFGAGLTAGAQGVLSDAGATALMNIGTEGSSSFAAGSSIGGAGVGSILGYGTALYNLSQGQYGSAVGTAIGTAILPGIGTAIGSLAGGLLDGLIGSFSGESRYGGSYNWTPEAGTVRGKWDDGDPGAEANQAITAIIDGAVEAINSAFRGVGSEASLSYFMGWAESSGKGRGGTASGGRLVIDGQEIAFGTTRKGEGYGDTSGDLSEMIQNMTVDIYQTIIEAWQVGIDAFPSLIRDMIGGIDPNSLDASQSAALVQQVLSTIEGVKAAQAALSELPMEAFSSLSFDAAANLLKVSGSIENLIGVIQTYSDTAFTDAEKVEMAQGRLSDAFAQLGLEVPTSVQALRALVDAQGMATEEDQRRTLALMSLAPALVEVTAAAEAMAERMRGLTATYFSLFKSSQEQYDLAARDLAAQFEKLGYALPKTASEYTNLVDSIDMSTASSRALKEQLLALAQPMRNLIDQAAQLGKALMGPSANDIYQQQVAIVEQLRAKVSALASEVQQVFANRNAAQSLSAQISQALGGTISSGARQAELWGQINADITPGQRLDAAQELFGLLTQIAPPDTSAQEAAVTAAQEARTAAQEQRSAAQAAMSAAQQQLSAAKSLQDAGRRLREYVQGLRSSDLSPLTMAEKVAEAAGHYQRTLSAAQGGDEEALSNLQSVSSDYLDLARQYYASNQAYTNIFNSVTGALDALGSGLLGQGDSAASIAQAQLDAAQAALAAAEQQIAATEAQIQTAQSQLETARVGNGLTADQIAQLKNLQSIVEVIQDEADASFNDLSGQLGQELALLDSMEKALGLQSTVPGLLAGLPAGIAAALAPILDANANKYVQGLYQEFLSRPADQGGMEYWMDQFDAGNKTLQDYLWSANEEQLTQAYRQTMGRDPDEPGLEFYLRQMQSGRTLEEIIKDLEWAKLNGSHAAGLPYVPFDGYRAELHKGERVLTAQENREYSAINWNRYGRGDDAMRAVVAELRAVKQEVSELRAQQAQASVADTQVQLQVGERVARAVQSGIAEGVETGRTRNVRLT